MVNAEIISVGTELLLGHVVNLDAALAGRLLAELGIDLKNMQVVGDNPERLKAALRLAASRADIIITTGGLGPTGDDVTRFVCAEFASKELELNEALRAGLATWFGSDKLAENQLRQAMAPKNALIFPNAIGTAPGMAIPLENGKYILLLPGPPAELAPMLENSVKPFLERLSSRVICSSVIRVFGKGEGEVDALLEDLLNSVNPTVAPYFSEGEVFVKLTARAPSRDAAQLLTEPVLSEIRSRLGGSAYGVDVANLEEVVVSALIEKNLTVATAESCTGGLLAKRITDRPGASAIFHLGLVTYANEAKIRLLHVPPAVIAEYGAVSEQTARAMASGAASVADADFGIGITGIAGPAGGTPEKPVGLVYIALQTPDRSLIHEMKPTAHYRGRDWVRLRATSQALFMLHEALGQFPK